VSPAQAAEGFQTRAAFLVFSESRQHESDPMLVHLSVLRALRGLSQGQLSDLADLNRFYVARLERGERPRSVQEIERLATALNVPTTALTAKTISIDRDGGVSVSHA
jgi:hypothetical protein